MTNTFILVQDTPRTFMLKCTVCHVGYLPTQTGLAMAWSHQEAANCSSRGSA